MTAGWKDYQEEAAAFFRALGLDAQTDVTVQGVRTKHDVDVLVKSHHVGFEITWLVECKHWKSPVSKLHVLALREIVADVGADRGILLAESGYQSGAVEAANLTNVQVTSLAEATGFTRETVYAMRLRELYDRVEQCSERYWDIPKDERIAHGLRPEMGGWDFSGARAVDLCRDLLTKAFRGLYPVSSDEMAAAVDSELQRQFHSPEELVAVVETRVSELERRLAAYDARE
ncbi:restriction endonuclease [Xanthomonas sp. WHRI 7945]|nr:restriction endonuclease [Xanthomonas campestris pv. campestris]